MKTNLWTKRSIMHIPLGVINGIVYIISPIAGIGLTLAFLGYEYLQEWRKVDHSYKDTIGWLIGLYGILGVVVVLCIMSIIV